MAWMTQNIPRVLEAWHHAGTRRVEVDLLRHRAPVHVQGINCRGVLPVPVAWYRLILATCHSRLFVSIEMLDFCTSHLHSGIRPFCSFPSLIPCMRGFFHAIRLLRPDRLYPLALPLSRISAPRKHGLTAS